MIDLIKQIFIAISMVFRSINDTRMMRSGAVEEALFQTNKTLDYVKKADTIKYNSSVRADDFFLRDPDKDNSK